MKADKELIIVFLLVLIVGIIYFFVENQIAFLNFFYLPVVLGAFFSGKKHGTYSALLSVLMIVCLAYFIPNTLSYDSKTDSSVNKWLDITIWGSFLIVTGYSMGYLYEKKELYNKELNTTYHGIITMLSIVIDSVDKYTQNHAYRVSMYAEKIARAAGLTNSEVQDIKTASLLHDIGKIGVSAEILNKIGKLTEDEKKEMMKHTGKASEFLEPVGGRILKILPLILGHHERYDGKGYQALIGDSIPIGARIIAVADVYDALTTDRPYRKALSPLDGKNEILKGSGSHFDPEIVKYFDKVFTSIDEFETNPA
ncbi:MAG: HD-GYP domain-containing protein [Candidatus Schekmanbacteria bacterium]|nr:HD-GYP domain-containing protein [Candidatus Schekmanbacteria bacterium]